MILRQIEFLRNLEQLRFTGQLIQTDSTEQQWIIYLNQGRIVYATGGVHPVRRWRRNLITYCPRIQTYRLAWQIDLAKVAANEFSLGWEYALLKFWVTQKRITQAQAEQMIRAAIVEVFFDVMQASGVTERIQYYQSISTFSSPVEIGEAISKVERLRQIWQNAQLNAYSPNHAPVIKQPEQLQQWGLAPFYQPLLRLLNGQRTLRDVAVEVRQDVVDVALPILRCVQLGWIEFVSIADLPGLVFRPAAPALPAVSVPKALIACIDDSPMVRKMMEELIASSGYQFLGVEDPLRAIGVLLARKPELIFLDLVMPNVNGYEICEKLRKLSCFRQTPIVILTGSDGYANRLRSNFVGATEFLSKPLNAEAVLGVINKHLKPAELPSTKSLS
ncbi:MAG: response regulator [Cyanobacteria bacterium RM1_2_2]|nr:response regulator [Cyanobacteria bacterium RM1_2_2]